MTNSGKLALVVTQLGVLCLAVPAVAANGPADLQLTQLTGVNGNGNGNGNVGNGQGNGNSGNGQGNGQGKSNSGNAGTVSGNTTGGTTGNPRRGVPGGNSEAGTDAVVGDVVIAAPDFTRRRHRHHATSDVPDIEPGLDLPPVVSGF